MPQVPALPDNGPTGPAAQSAASGGPSPVQYLMAAADMKSSGALSAPVPKGKDPMQLSHRGRKHLQILK